MRLAAAIGLAALGVSTAAFAEDGVDPEALADVVASACVFDTLDFDAEYAALTAAAAESGLALVVEQDKNAIFGDPAGVNLVVGRQIDELFCTLNIPAPLGTKELFAVFEAKVGAAVAAVHPKHISVPDDDPSPHIDGHDWVASYPGEMHYAATIDWSTDDGLQIGVGFRQLYE